jgi:hypothetical protein
MPIQRRVRSSPRRIIIAANAQGRDFQAMLRLSLTKATLEPIRQTDADDDQRIKERTFEMTMKPQTRRELLVAGPAALAASAAGNAAQKAHLMQSLARTVGVAGSATLILACAMVCSADARGGGGGGGHGAPSFAASREGASPGGSMMGVTGLAGTMSTTNSNAVGCIDNKYSSRCAGTKRNTAK